MNYGARDESFPECHDRIPDGCVARYRIFRATGVSQFIGVEQVAKVGLLLNAKIRNLNDSSSDAVRWSLGNTILLIGRIREVGGRYISYA